MQDWTRRDMLGATSAGFAALALAACGGGNGTPVGSAAALPPTPSAPPLSPIGYGALVSDPAGLLDLPAGFSYRVLSSLGDAMSDGGTVPDDADGMGCIDLGGGKIALVRNHELSPGASSGGARGPAFARSPAGTILPGGTTTLVLDAASLAVERQFRSQAGTIRNCAGGTTPWGTWLTCEEDVTRAGSASTRDHGWVFEVDPLTQSPASSEPLVALGRFNHEAAAVDPASGIVYLTEDRSDGLLYRMIPNTPGKLADGGKLQALALAPGGSTDSRNWDGVSFAVGASANVRWIDLDNPASPNDDLRTRGLAAGALRFARGEGIHVGLGEVFFTCTSGGAAKLGQIFRLTPGAAGDRLQLFLESTARSDYYYGDNLIIAPDGQLVVCEDQPGSSVDNYLRGIARDGRHYPLARVRIQTEPAGVCFSPDGKVMFVNLYSPTKTLAITGPWQHLR